ncbi:MAG: zinc-ribbon domain-containing protein [Caldiserica bacterium]|jgi:hypothetical protein|nr:zinc-ribbon domain-containing protein [Caldisericota bacterium]MDH7563030.1 zinc-ribbon domain-containing protein [Caldisericota bacterium]
MFCPKCGKENEEGASFCSQCGYSFQPSQGPTGKKNFLTYFLVGILVLAIAGGAYFLANSLLRPTQVSQMELASLVPQETGIFLTFTSQQGSLEDLFESLKISASFSELGDSLEGLASDPVAQEILKAVKPNIQLAVSFKGDRQDYYLLGELRDPSQGENLQEKIVEEYQKQGKQAIKKQVGNATISGFPDEEAWVATRGGIFYVASSEEALNSILEPRGSTLEKNSLYRSILEKVPKNPSIFLFINFSYIPELPSQIHHLYLFSDEVEGSPHLKGEVVVDLDQLLGSPPSKEFKEVFSVLKALVNSPGEKGTPFGMVPPTPAFAFTTFGWLGSLLESGIVQDYLPPSLPLGFLNGKTEFFIGEMEGVEGMVPFGISVEIPPENYPDATQTLNQFDEIFSNISGGEVVLENVEIEGVLSRKVSTPDGNFYYALTDKHFFLAPGAEPLKAMIGREKGTKESLSSQEYFKHLSSLMEDYHFCFFLDGGKLQEILQKLQIPMEGDFPIQLKGRSILFIKLRPGSITFEGFSLNP